MTDANYNGDFDPDAYVPASSGGGVTIGVPRGPLSSLVSDQPATPPSPVAQLVQANGNAAPAQRGILDKLLGLSGPRYELWPERLVRSALTAPGDAMTGQVQTMDPNNRGFPTDDEIQRVQDLAAVAGLGSMPRAALGETGTLGMAGGKAIQPELPAGEVFHSAVEHALANAPQDKMTGTQWLGWLKNQPGVKQDELDWLGFKPGSQSVSKADMLAHAEGHGVRLQEVERTGEPLTDESIGNRAAEIMAENHPDLTPPHAEYYDNYDWALTQAEEELRGEAGEAGEDTGAPAYSEYQLPGGDNYRELLLIKPNRERKYTLVDGFNDEGNVVVKNRLTGEVAHEGTHRSAAQYLREQDGNAPYDYHSSHWGEPNVLVHMRMNDRSIPENYTPEQRAALRAHADAQPELDLVRNEQHRVARQIQDVAAPLEAKRRAQILADNKAGKLTNPEAMRELESYDSPPEIKGLQDELQRLRARADEIRGGLPAKPAPQSLKSLHLEEVQSDWHQAGRKQGYASEPTPQQLETEAQSVYELPFNQLDTGRQAELKRRIIERGVPDAPFKTTWADLALKRAIAKAAREGYDAISWTPGEQQAERYDLSKQVREIGATKNKDNTYDIRAIPTGSQVTTPIASHVPSDKIADYVGKDLADRIIKEVTPGQPKWKIYSGLDLKVGGEGMKAFYDKMLVAKANAIGKKFGAKVEYKELPLSNEHAVVSSNYPGRRPGGHYVIRERADGISSIVEPFYTVEEAQARADKLNQRLRVPVLRLTPQLKDTALHKGFPLFMHGSPFMFTPVQHKDRK